MNRQTNMWFFRTPTSLFLAASAISLVLASYGGSIWWIPFGVALILAFLGGEANPWNLSRKDALAAASVIALPLLASITWQIVEDLTRSYSSNDYSLTTARAPLHLALAVLGGSWALRAGRAFHLTGSKTGPGRAVLLTVRFVSVPLFGLGVVYLSVTSWIGLRDWATLSRFQENVGLLQAHLFFASSILGISIASFIYCNRRLRRG